MVVEGMAGMLKGGTPAATKKGIDEEHFFGERVTVTKR